ncbi:MAG: bifunctional riboflavin kinase/FAD synthetase [Bacteroidales bacterium]|nr:bifunctional riboflavin kinase/FAD synthetase [Bacteroidales bacterium]MBN2818851.1 bifunctional riboflavin kinase/FAD synthetase [Bacteroidales bacterium]
MKVNRSLTGDINKKTIATLGIFDGVHLAHQQILCRIKELSEQLNKESMLISLWPHPRYVLNKDAENLKLISTLDEKLEKIKEYGIDNVLLIPFDKQFASIPFDKFIKKILVDKLQIQHLVVGFNHQFGRNRQGNFENLRTFAEKYGFVIEQLNKAEVNNVGVSSSTIRKNIYEGNIEMANQMLGYIFYIKGKVVHGNKVGRNLGFPTANISIPEIYKIIPADGVYAVEGVIENKKYQGMMNIGTRPTFGDKGVKVIEVNFFNFNQNIYEKEVKLFFHKRVREEKKFASIEELIKQIENDKKQIVDYLTSIKKQK